MAAIRIKPPSKPLLTGGHVPVKSRVLHPASPISIAEKKSWAQAPIRAAKVQPKGPLVIHADPPMDPALNSLMHLLESPTSLRLALMLGDLTRPAANVRAYAEQFAPAAQLRKLDAALEHFTKAVPASIGKEAPTLDPQYAALKHEIGALEDAIKANVEKRGFLDVTSRARLTQVAFELDALESNAASLARKVVSGEPAGTSLAKLVTLSSADIATLKTQLSDQASTLRAPLTGLGLTAHAKKLSTVVRLFSTAQTDGPKNSGFDTLMGQMAEVEHALNVQLRRGSLTAEGKSSASSVALQLGVMHDAAANIAGRVATLRPGSVLLEQLAKGS